MKPAPEISSSQHTSTNQIEKEKTLSRASSKQNFEQEKEKKAVVTTPLANAEAIDILSDEPEYPSGAKLGIVMASLCLSVFLMALVGPILQTLPVLHARTVSIVSMARDLILSQDNTIIATAIPKITDHFKALDDVGWYGAGRHVPLSYSKFTLTHPLP